jgi:hypothetical protein
VRKAMRARANIGDVSPSCDSQSRRREGAKARGADGVW